MKTKNTIYGLWAVLSAGLLLTACDDDDTWTPGPIVGDGNPNIVYFLTSPASAELEENSTADYTLQVSRVDSTEAISVPLVATDTINYDVPATIEFPAGVGTTSINVHFKGADDSGNYDQALSVEDERYSSPYTTYACRVDIQLTVSKWELLGRDVYVHEYYGALPEFTCDIYQTTNGSKFMFKNFAEGYDLKFTKGDYVSGYGYYIIPSGGSWYDTYWYFGDDQWNDSYPLYWNNLENGQYVDYAAMYTHSTYSTIDFETKYGWMCLYCNIYDSEGNAVNSSLWAYLEFWWD